MPSRANQAAALLLTGMVSLSPGLPSAEPAGQAVVNGTRLAYHDAGQGEPVVLVHGSLSDYRIWAPEIARFAAGYRVIAYSRRDHHPNERATADADISLERHADDLAALIRTLDLGPAHLVGHSYGANIAAHMARRHPELVRSLVLAEPTLFELVGEPERAGDFFERAPRAMEQTREAIERGDEEGAVRAFFDLVLGPGGFDRLPEPAHAMVMDNAHTLQGRVAAAGAPRPFTCEDARALTMPTLLLGGETSPKAFGLILDALQHCLPDADRVTLAGVGHALKIPDPGPFDNAVLAFLAERAATGYRTRRHKAATGSASGT